MDWPLPGPDGFDLERVLRQDRIEFWYQPKIDLRKKRLAGVEVFARFCDSDGNIIPGAELISGASDRVLVSLTERALLRTLKTSANLLEIGIDVRFAVNANVAALVRLPLAEMVQKYHLPKRKGASVIFDVTEKEVLGSHDKMRRVSLDLGRDGLCIAIDDFGAALLSIAQEEEAYGKIEQTFDAIRKLGNIRFAEMKLDRTLVRNCSDSPDRQKVCEYIIKMTHEFGANAVAVGIENANDLETLKRLGCDIGQGFLFGRPMTEDELLVLLWERAAGAKKKAAHAV
ncbi:MAG: EAL domain-containing protein [Bradyrhizobiaceae bacterium]|nr:EAL domain-containing protein [Bradyrhizobiaceae bacterium]